MTYTKTKLAPYIFLKAIFFSLAASLYSQETLQYKGEYQVGQYKGDASFGYKVVDSVTVLDGPFQISRSNLEELLQQQDSSFSFVGAFQDNYPIGTWRFNFGKFVSERETEVVNYQYRVSVSGIQEETYGELAQGKPNGQWIIAVDSIVQSEVEQTLFKSTIEYENGIPQKSFRIENDQYTLVGRSLRNGLAHDQWSLYSSTGSAIESWYFDNGVLSRLVIGEDDQMISLPIYRGRIDDGKTVNINEQFLKTLQIKAFSVGGGIEIDSGLYSLLEENASRYSKIDNILSSLGESQFSASFKVKVEQFPLDATEISQLDSIKIIIRRAGDISESILDNTQLNIIKLSDQEASFYHEVVKELSSRFVRPIEKLIGFRDEQILETVTREELLSYLWQEGMPEIDIVVDQDGIEEGQNFLGPEARELDFGEMKFGTVLRMAQYAYASLDSIQEILSTKLNIEKRQQELIQIEDKLISQAKRVDQLVDSLKTVTSGAVRESLDKIKSLSKDNLSTYSGIEEKEEKLSYGRQLLICLKIMEELAGKVGDLPAQEDEIREVYIDDIWNPHMAVIMKDDIKKRITAAYQRIIIPDILEKIKTELKCDNADTYSTMLTSLYQRMLEMREEDTSKLERKLKKENDPKEILRMFNVEPIYTD